MLQNNTLSVPHIPAGNGKLVHDAGQRGRDFRGSQIQLAEYVPITIAYLGRQLHCCGDKVAGSLQIVELSLACIPPRE